MRTLTHIDLARFEIVFWIQLGIAFTKYIRFQDLTECEELLRSALRILRDHFLLPRSCACFLTPDRPRLREFPNIISHVNSGPRKQIISENAVIVSAKSTQLILVHNRNLYLYKVIAIPCQFNPKGGTHDHLCTIITFEHIQNSIHFVRRINSTPIDLNTHLLP